MAPFSRCKKYYSSCIVMLYANSNTAVLYEVLLDNSIKVILDGFEAKDVVRNLVQCLVK